jgi:hypothetical protein
MVVYKDRVGQVTSTTGSGDYSLGSVVSGFQSFDSVGDGNQCHYTIRAGADWEVGLGTLTVGTPSTLSRDEILDSSTGVAIDWPAGAKSIYLTSPAQMVGATIIPITAAEIAAGVTPTDYQYQPGDVRRYGADPTGVADSTAAIQAASSASDRVSIEDGVYLTNQITLADGRKYEFYGKNCELKLIANASGPMIFNDDLTFVDRLEVRGIQFNGNKANQTGWLNDGFRIHARHLVIEGCEFFGFKGMSVSISHVADYARIVNNTFRDAAEHSGVLGENSGYVSLRTNPNRATSDKQNIIIASNSFVGFVPSTFGHGVFGILAAGNSALTHDDSHRLLITGNTFYECGQNAAGNKAGAITLYRRCDRSIVTNNYIYGGDEVGIDVQLTRRCIVANNLIDRVYLGIGVTPRIDTTSQPSSRVLIANNIISNLQDPTTGAIYARSGESTSPVSTDLTIIGNQIENAAQGVQVQYMGGGIQIIGNNFKDIFKSSPSTGQRAIDFVGGTATADTTARVVISNNVMQNSENLFVSMRYYAGPVTICDNIVDDVAATRAITVFGCPGDFLVRGNQFIDCPNDLMSFDTCTGRLYLQQNMGPDGATIRRAGGSVIRNAAGNSWNEDLIHSLAHDFGATDGETVDTTVTGAATGDAVIVSFAGATANVHVRGVVQSADTVRLIKTGTGDPPSVTYWIRVIKRWVP